MASNVVDPLPMAPTPTPSASPSVPPSTPKSTSRFKLPSRGWLIFLGTTVSITTLILRDKYLSKVERERQTNHVKHLSMQILKPNEMPRKLRFYLAPGQTDAHISTVKYQFGEYVKPVLDAAALDYELIVASQPYDGKLANRVKEWVWRGKKQELLAALHERLEREDRGRYFFQRIFGFKKSVLSEQDEALLSKDPMEYFVDEIKNGRFDSTTGLVAFGRNAYIEMMKGLHEGYTTEPDLRADQQKPVKEPVATVEEAEKKDEPSNQGAEAVEASPTEKVETVQTVETVGTAEDDTILAEPILPPPTIPTEPAPLPPLIPPTPTSIDLPPIAYLPLQVHVGFIRFPIRMYWFMNDHKIIKKVGDQVVQIALNSTRPFNSQEDLQVGMDEPGVLVDGEEYQTENGTALPAEFLNRVKVYDTAPPSTT